MPVGGDDRRARRRSRRRPRDSPASESFGLPDGRERRSGRCRGCPTIRPRAVCRRGGGDVHPATFAGPDARAVTRRRRWGRSAATTLSCPPGPVPIAAEVVAVEQVDVAVLADGDGQVRGFRRAEVGVGQPRHTAGAEIGVPGVECRWRRRARRSRRPSACRRSAPAGARPTGRALPGGFGARRSAVRSRTPLPVESRIRPAPSEVRPAPDCQMPAPSPSRRPASLDRAARRRRRTPTPGRGRGRSASRRRRRRRLPAAAARGAGARWRR